ncbi:MAG: MBL fold metallo-hydrolase [Lachnospiraceae bacterium]|nr:MBL fold metallo-hydrolase [Lachnospiraceae bacterium]
MSIKISKLVLGFAQTNCYLVHRDDEDVKEVLIFDPADRGEYIYEKLKEKGLDVAGIFLTHGHFDHLLGANKLRDLSGAKIYACSAEKEVCEDSGKNFTAEVGISSIVIADEYLDGGDELSLAGLTIRVIATPGHTIGSCCYYFSDDTILISGDTLFQESVGRTDLPTGNMNTLVNSIREKLFILPDETRVYPGHGEPTSIGNEKENNPFVRS